MKLFKNKKALAIIAIFLALLGFVATKIYRQMNPSINNLDSVVNQQELHVHAREYIDINQMASRTGIPQKRIDDKYPGVSIYWFRESVVDGHDSCSIFDSKTNQIYATKDYSNQFTFYINDRISGSISKDLLNQWCYQ